MIIIKIIIFFNYEIGRYVIIINLFLNTIAAYLIFFGKVEKELKKKRDLVTYRITPG